MGSDLLLEDGDLPHSRWDPSCLSLASSQLKVDTKAITQAPCPVKERFVAPRPAPPRLSTLCPLSVPCCHHADEPSSWFQPLTGRSVLPLTSWSPPLFYLLSFLLSKRSCSHASGDALLLLTISNAVVHWSLPYVHAMEQLLMEKPTTGPVARSSLSTC